MGKFVDLTRMKFNKLTVITRAENGKFGNAKWLCQCDCGNITIVASKHLKTGETKSCGCLKKDSYKYKHRLSKTRIYRIYRNMKRRCYCIKEKDYKHYGGRGIKVYAEWLDKENGFMNFYNWSMQNGYRDDLSIDRINVNGNYEPSNCRWATAKQQANNKRNNHFILYNGEIYTIAEWSNILNIRERTIRDRIKRNFPKELWFYQGKITPTIKKQYENNIKEE